MDNQNLFSQTYDQIRAQLTGSGNNNFQMLGNPIDFSWPVAPLGQMSPNAYQIISIMPKWSPIGVYSAGDARFFDAYTRVLSLITFKVSPEKQQDLQRLQDQITIANNALQQVISNANTAYQTAKQNGGDIFAAQYPDITTWLSGPGSTFTNQITQNTALVKSLQDQYASLAASISIDPTLQRDFAAVQTPTGAVSGPSPAGWTKVPNSDGNLEWRPTFDISTTGQDFRAQLSSGSQGAFSIQLSAANSTSSLDKSWAGGSAGYDAVFWAVRGSGGWERTDFSQADNSITATVSVQSSTTVPITPGGWYDGGLMKALARTGEGYGAKLVAPWVAKGPNGSQSVFGQYGLLSTRVSGLVVAYKPKFSLTMQSSTYQKYSQKINASSGIRIGPFTFGGSGGHESLSVKSTGNKTVIEGGSTSDDPLIIGLTVAFPGLDEA